MAAILSRPQCVKCPLVAAHCGLCLHTNTTQVPLWMYAGTVVGQARLEYGTILVRMYRTLKENSSLQRYLYTYTMYIPLYKGIIRHGHAWFILITMDNHKGDTYMDGRIIFFMLIHYILIKISVMDKSLSVNNQRFCLRSFAILSRITTYLTHTSKHTDISSQW